MHYIALICFISCSSKKGRGRMEKFFGLFDIGVRNPAKTTIEGFEKLKCRSIRQLEGRQNRFISSGSYFFSSGIKEEPRWWKVQRGPKSEELGARSRRQRKLNPRRKASPQPPLNITVARKCSDHYDPHATVENISETMAKAQLALFRRGLSLA